MRVGILNKARELKMKKILFIVHNLKFGGIQKITLELARNHIKMGNEVHIFCLEKGQSLPIDFECDIHTLDLSKLMIRNPVIAAYYVLYKSILRHLLPRSEFYFSTIIYKKLVSDKIHQIESDGRKLDAIFIRGARSVQRMWWYKKDNAVFSLHLPFSLSTTTGLIGKYNNWLTSKLFHDKIFFSVSEYIRHSVEQSLKIQNVTPKKHLSIHNPCDIGRVRHLSSQDINIYDGDFILGVGRLTNQKRFDLLIKAFHRINPADCKLIILGEGNQRRELEKLINELDLAEKVIMPGFVDNPYVWYKKAKLFVLSSDCEGFGNAIVEALACGTPVVSTNCGPVNEILTGELKKGLVSKGDFIALANVMAEYLKNPIVPSDKNVERFSFGTIIKQQLDLLNDSDI
nr:glycosyltransferase [Moritella viscosa]